MKRPGLDLNDPPPSNAAGGGAARGALAAAVVGALVWIAGLAALLLAGAELGRAALLALAAAGPVLGGAAVWAVLTAGERLERRIARLEKIAGEAAEAARAAEGDRGEKLARAMANAAREALDAERSAMARRLAEIGEAQRQLAAQIEAAKAIPASDPPQTALAEDPAPAPVPASAPAPAAPPAEDRRQPALPLAGGAAAEPAAIDWANVAVALDFPRDANDSRGFAALRAAVRHRMVSEVLQAAEDILTILAQDALYMEDMTAAPAALDAWRAYLDGARGREVAAICGVENEAAEAKIRARMQSDPVFRDTAMHLIRRYDSMLRRAFAECKSDEDLRAVIDNRTGRAFMLIAKIVGSFD